MTEMKDNEFQEIKMFLKDGENHETDNIMKLLEQAMALGEEEEEAADVASDDIGHHESMNFPSTSKRPPNVVGQRTYPEAPPTRVFTLNKDLKKAITESDLENPITKSNLNKSTAGVREKRSRDAGYWSKRNARPNLKKSTEKCPPVIDGDDPLDVLLRNVKSSLAMSEDEEDAPAETVKKISSNNSEKVETVNSSDNVETVPKSKPKKEFPPTPWWSDDLEASREVREKYYQRYRKYPTQKNLSRWKKSRAEHKTKTNLAKGKFGIFKKERYSHKNDAAKEKLAKSDIGIETASPPVCNLPENKESNS